LHPGPGSMYLVQYIVQAVNPQLSFSNIFYPFRTGIGYKWSLKISGEQDLHKLKRYKTSFGTR
jgi:hypothetical protein